MDGSWSAPQDCALQTRLAAAPAAPLLAALLCGAALGAACAGCCARAAPLLAAARLRGDRVPLRDEERGGGGLASGAQDVVRETVWEPDLPRDEPAAASSPDGQRP